MVVSCERRIAAGAAFVCVGDVAGCGRAGAGFDGDLAPEIREVVDAALARRPGAEAEVGVAGGVDEDVSFEAAAAAMVLAFDGADASVGILVDAADEFVEMDLDALVEKEFEQLKCEYLRGERGRQPWGGGVWRPRIRLVIDSALPVFRKCVEPVADGEAQELPGHAAGHLASVAVAHRDEEVDYARRG